MQNVIQNFLFCRRCRVSASQSSCNWFHTCLYHIINESTRRITAAASHSSRARRWGEKTERHLLLLFPWPSSLPEQGSDFLLRFYFQGLWPLRHATLQLIESIKRFCLFLLPFFLQSPLATTTIILGIGGDFLPVPAPDSTFQTGKLYRAIRSSLWDQSRQNRRVSFCLALVHISIAMDVGMVMNSC